MHLIRPTLPSTHRNFFVIYAATMIYHLWCGLNAVLGPDKWFQLESLTEVNRVADPVVWGSMNLFIVAGLFVGLHVPDFDLISRRFLALGLLWVTIRFVLIAAGVAKGYDVANSLPNLFLCGAVHLAQTLEPSANPVTARSK